MNIQPKYRVIFQIIDCVLQSKSFETEHEAYRWKYYLERLSYQYILKPKVEETKNE